MKNNIICICNEVPKSTIENAIARGCNTLSKIAAATTAGVGQCGGSCRPEIEMFLEQDQKSSPKQNTEAKYSKD